MDCVSMGKIIKEYRLSCNMTQKELGEKINVSDKAVSKWERGICFPDISMLEPLAEALGISVNNLISQEERSQLKKIKRNKALIAVCIIFFILGFLSVLVYLLFPFRFLMVKRVYILIYSSIYLFLFVLSILFVWRKETDD